MDQDILRKTSYRDQSEERDFVRPETAGNPEEETREDVFMRLTADENIYNSRGLAHAPKMDESCRERYLQMGCCAQMHSCQWTDAFPAMSAESEFPIVQVRFKNTHKEFFRLPENEDPKIFHTGDIVVVESTNGHDTGVICLQGELVRLQLKKRNLKPDAPEIRKIYRKARQNDVDKWTETIQAEKEMQRRARVIAAQLGLSMKINNVEIQGDFTKAIFYYTADDRVDFRQLIKLYAEEFKIRIEMRQIGARQESGILGGIGACGRELCCVTFLHNFSSVGTHAARVQQVSLNPQKLAGQCSKLKCCLNYEYEVYADAMKSMPDAKAILKTEKGDARCVKMDPLRRRLTYSYIEIPGSYVDLTADQVFDILDRNRNGVTVTELEELTKDTRKPEKTQPEFKAVVGQDDLTRFDKPKENKGRNRGERRKGNGNGGNHNGNTSKPNKKPAHSLQKPVLKNNHENRE
ncbi:MAG: hypothetical protein NC048_04345 [Bacteroides sp.]|nr:hypothetical protein [Ruminococcus flavefaciens]MCM1554705.1 hypothetical protein [Bacteroides sp.]